LCYLLKERVGAVEDFLRTIDRVVGGETVLDPDVVSTLMRRGRSPSQPSPHANATCWSS
jgi:DNA-binding NarL/FixJ family response regulator